LNAFPILSLFSNFWPNLSSRCREIKNFPNLHSLPVHDCTLAPKKVILPPTQESKGEGEEQPVPAGHPHEGGTLTHSGRQVKAPTRKGNIYGEAKAPMEILRETARTHSWSKKVGESSQGSRTPALALLAEAKLLRILHRN
jgi:hypothetical protein